MELFEDVLDLSIGYAATSIVHFNHQDPIPTAAFDPYSAPLGVLDCIANEVVQHTSQHLTVGVYEVPRLGNLKDQLPLFASGDHVS